MQKALFYSAFPTLSVVAGLGAGMMMAGGPSSAVTPEAFTLAAPEAAPHAPADDVQHDSSLSDHVASGDPADRIVPLGRVTVPVHKARTVSYVVTDFGISVSNAALAEAYREVGASLRLRSALLTAISEATSLPVMRGASIDTEALSALLKDQLTGQFDGVEEVLFLSFYKADVPRA